VAGVSYYGGGAAVLDCTGSVFFCISINCMFSFVIVFTPCLLTINLDVNNVLITGFKVVNGGIVNNLGGTFTSILYYTK
jgi:hypothetical protein